MNLTRLHFWQASLDAQAPSCCQRICRNPNPSQAQNPHQLSDRWMAASLPKCSSLDGAELHKFGSGAGLICRRRGRMHLLRILIAPKFVAEHEDDAEDHHHHHENTDEVAAFEDDVSARRLSGIQWRHLLPLLRV